MALGLVFLLYPKSLMPLTALLCFPPFKY